MIKSMTAFASLDRASDNMAAAIEIRTYNSRHLDVVMRISPGYQQLEEKIRGVITETIERGRVDVKLQIKDASDAVNAYEIDEEKARAYYSALRDMQSLLGMVGEIPLELIATRGELIKPKEKEFDVEAVWHFLEACVKETLAALNAMRQREGAYIADDFLSRLKFIKEGIDQIETQSAGMPVQYRQRLMERIAVITGDAVELDAGRVEQEAAMLADKSDISEEIIRVNSHLEQFKKIMKTESPAGQKLNFLLQEINREFNTIGSKAGKAEISHVVVDVKSELEKLREQVQNVE